ncbi:50S ribosomal protein L1 [Patescibacteria group bacterium]|nr:50S ribosomal protein L1 [Patescibacteria group bacterium]MBU1015857.1 50S ribosomal protein L1 [Patescibacteria group bacterium]MBU1685394.1 50S ribosomal protein L1 [Patescibacteria group bacterium]MBU1938447.1 50S ribosomal protein L1 [Patescibacteria group bacterium]
MMKRGKKYTESLKKLGDKKSFPLPEAVRLLKETGTTKFDSTAEVHINLNIDSTKADQVIRGTINLPHGSGKKVRIAALVTDDKIKAAKDAGADEAGLEDLVAEFEKGKINFDVIIAMPAVMKQIGKVAKILGQKGLMPNPKAGTVTDDVVKTIKELKAGRLEYRNDKEGNVHSIFGKLSFKEEELENNFKSFLRVIREAKPSSIKGSFIKSITITSTMSPGIKLDVNEALKAL